MSWALRNSVSIAPPERTKASILWKYMIHFYYSDLPPLFKTSPLNYRRWFRQSSKVDGWELFRQSTEATSTPSTSRILSYARIESCSFRIVRHEWQYYIADQCKEIPDKLNPLLPRDIRVIKAVPVNPYIIDFDFLELLFLRLLLLPSLRVFPLYSHCRFFLQFCIFPVLQILWNLLPDPSSLSIS